MSVALFHPVWREEERPRATLPSLRDRAKSWVDPQH
jgi:hypothetical protein